MELRLTKEEVRSGCGAGQGARCCKYLLLTSTGFICGRETELKQVLIEAVGYSAQRMPEEAYPGCQLKATGGGSEMAQGMEVTESSEVGALTVTFQRGAQGAGGEKFYTQVVLRQKGAFIQLSGDQARGLLTVLKAKFGG